MAQQALAQKTLRVASTGLQLLPLRSPCASASAQDSYVLGSGQRTASALPLGHAAMQKTFRILVIAYLRHHLKKLIKLERAVLVLHVQRVHGFLHSCISNSQISQEPRGSTTETSPRLYLHCTSLASDLRNTSQATGSNRSMTKQDVLKQALRQLLIVPSGNNCQPQIARHSGSRHAMCLCDSAN